MTQHPTTEAPSAAAHGPRAPTSGPWKRPGTLYFYAGLFSHFASANELVLPGGWYGHPLCRASGVSHGGSPSGSAATRGGGRRSPRRGGAAPRS
jgi:hypothetical protein